MSTTTNTFKIVLIGDGGAGKTSICLRYTEGRFEQDLKMTIGVNLVTKRIVFDGKNITLIMWDLSGQPRFQDVVSEYFKGARLAIAVYDVTRPFTLVNLEYWIERLRQNSPNSVLFIVANKIDECDDMNKIIRDGVELSLHYGATFFAVSAKTGENIEEMFNAVARALVSDTQ